MKLSGTFTACKASRAAPTTEQMLADLDFFLGLPRLVGTLMGALVYVSGKAPDEVVEIRGNEQTIRFRLDHPYIKGTKLERDIRAGIER